MLRRNILSYTPNGEKILQIFMWMIYIPFVNFGIRQGRLGRRFCLHQYRPFFLSLYFYLKNIFSECSFSPWKYTLHYLSFFFLFFLYFCDMQGESFLVITHKSILRALICTALGLGPERYVFSVVGKKKDIISYSSLEFL